MKRLLLTSLFVVGLVWALVSYPGAANRGAYESIVLDFQPGLTPAQIENELATLSQTFGVEPRLNSEFSDQEQVYVLEGDAALLRRLRHSDLKQYTKAIDPNYIYQMQDVPNDPDYYRQWNLKTINVEPAWDQTRGEGVTIAVIDTGISPVPDLKNTKFVEGYDFVNNRTEATDDNGHGTHVAGTIAQSTNNNYGVAGIAYEAKLMPLKVLSASGAGEITDIAEAIRFAADHGADVINMSLGGMGDSAVLREAIDYAHNKGVVIVAAAGNANTNSASFPARYPNVIAVSATDSSGVKAPYSNFGAGVDIAAPGGSKTNGDAGGIVQETIDPQTGGSTFLAFQGTSMAAPHVAGVAALIKSVGVEEPNAIAKILKESALTIPDDALNHFGAGIVNANEAVKQAQRGNLDVKDFFRWLRENGYLNLKFWFDGGAVALLPKLAMVLGSYLLAWFLKNYLPIWSFSLAGGLVTGSSGLFFLRGLYRFDIPHFPFRLLGSSIPELGGAIQGSPLLNPVFASVLIPFCLVALLLGHPSWKWFAVGSTLGVASCLALSAAIDPGMVWLGDGLVARSFLAVNAILCVGLGYLAAKAANGEGRVAG